MRVYAEVLSGAPLNAINVSDIDLTSVPASQIKYTVQDNAGMVTNIIMGDVTGDSWIYGIGFCSRKKDLRARTWWKLMENGLSGLNVLLTKKKKYKKDNPNRFIDTCFVSMKYWDSS